MNYIQYDGYWQLQSPKSYYESKYRVHSQNHCRTEAKDIEQCVNNVFTGWFQHMHKHT